MSVVLVVEDDEALGAQIVDTIAAAGHDILWIRNGDAAKRAELREVDLVVLDLMLPGTYGLDLLKLYRTRSDVPVLILSARNETTDKVRALQLGADDYLTKPFWPEELIARVDARLRRPDVNRGDARVFGKLRIDVAARSLAVFRDETWCDVPTTSVEFAVLEALSRRPGHAITRQALADEVFDPHHGSGPRGLDAHISRLRKKLGAASTQLATVWGIGYRLDSDDT